MADERELKVKITGDGRGLVGTVQTVAKATEDLGKTTQTETNKGAQGVKGLSAEFLQLQDILDPTVANTRRLSAATDLLDRELKQGNLTVERHAALMARANQIYAQTHGRMQMMRGGVQQLSFQLQDVAVSAQMGMSAFTILGQQGSQIASLFGPGGAAIGALLAFGSAIVGGVVGALSQVGEEVDDLEDRIEGFIESTLIDRIDKKAQDLRAAEKALLQAGAVLNQVMAEQVSPTIQPWQENTLPSLDDARRRVMSLGEAVNNLNKELNDLRAEQAGQGGSGGSNRAAEAEARALQSLVDKLLPAQAATRDYEEAVIRLQAAIEQFPDKAALYRRALDTLRDGQHSTAASLVQLGVEIEGFSGTLTDNLDLAGQYLKSNMDAYYQSMQRAHDEHQDRLAVGTQVTAYAFENAWVSALKNGQDLWKAFADTAIEQILRIQYQMTIGQGIENFIRGALGGIFPGPAAPGGGHASTAGGDFGGITVPPTGLDQGGIKLDLGLRPTASRAAPDTGASIVINQVNDFSNVSSADEQRIRAMLDENSRQTEARIYQNINRGGAAARTVGRR